MKGDFSRFTFSPEKAYDGVLMQQGRVTIDSDLTEQWAIGDYRMRRTTADIIGPTGGPQGNAGFKISIAGATLNIGAGVYYVDGIRCVNDAQFPHNAQANLPAGSPVFHTLPAGPTVAPVAGRYLGYLDVSHRLITALEDPQIREVALTADTSARRKIMPQVRFVRIGNVGDVALTCDADFPAWQALITPPSGTLAARAKAASPSTNPCAMPETAGYNRMENHLYRVEIHKSGKVGAGATFKWARDNATLVVGWLASDGEKLTVSSVGHDRYSGFKNGQWIEVTDDDRERRGEPGFLARIKTVNGNVISVDLATAEGPLAIAGFGANPKIRGWDGAGALPVAIPASNNGFVEIENGLQVQFAANADYRVGDYWMIAARSGIGIEWPEVGGAPKALPPHGVAHAYARLAILDFDGTNWTAIGDCRKLFPPLTKLTSFVYLGGDGQEVMPVFGNPALLPLGKSLRAGVVLGEAPVVGARVRFKITGGNGRLSATLTEVVVATDANGVAEGVWSLDGTTLHQEVTAELLDSTGQRRGAPIRYSASLSRASEVSFDPTNTPEIKPADTVQEAIEALYNRKTMGGCATYVLSPDIDWVTVLKNLPIGQDAVICFRQGVYQTGAPIKFEGLRHVSLHGAGEATQISVARSESALEFIACASVTIRDLFVDANETGGDWTPVKHLNGAVTAVDCGSIEVSGCTLRCGASAANERTCLTLRVTPHIDPTQTRKPFRSARVYDNRFIVGYGQTGLLLADSLFTQVRDNQFEAQARPASLNFDKLVAEPKRRGLIAKQLLAGIATSKPAAGVGEVHVGRFKVELGSSVPQAEWRTLISAHPPQPGDLTSADKVREYMGRIAGTGLAVSDGTAIGRASSAMRKAIGPAVFDTLPQQAKEGLLLGDVTVTDVKDTPGATVVVEVGQVTLALNSTIPQKEWNAMVKASPPGAITEYRAAATYVRKLVGKLVSDPAFREKAPSAKGRLDGYQQDNPAYGARAIICAGTLSREVQITGNLIQSFYEGIRVAVSEEGGNKERYVSLKNVVISENILQLRIPFDYDMGRFGILVGNAEAIRVIGNSLTHAESQPEKKYKEGIRIFGHLGPMMILKENRISAGVVGMRVEHVGPQPDVDNLVWRATDNMVDNNNGSILAAPPQVRERDNGRS